MFLGLFHIVAVVLAVAGLAKIRRPESTMAAIGRSRQTVLLLGAFEMGLAAAALLIGATPVGWLVALVYSAFTVWTWSRLSQSCGCFGNATSITATHVAINASSAVIAAAAAGGGIGGLPSALSADWAQAGPLLATIALGAGVIVLLLNRPGQAPEPTFGFTSFTSNHSSSSTGNAAFDVSTPGSPTLFDRLTNRTTQFAQTAVSRRSFLGKAALVGTALAVNPAGFIFKPVTAYAAICNCSGQDCECESLCCDGYTEFCCTMYGENSCPPGSIAAGWWKADGSGFCDVDGVAQPRYYIDCNAECGGCTCVNGFCDSSCTFCDCECGNGECGNRKACCTKFRYGQCNQDATCIGPIVCRVITCVPPWVWDPSCGTTSATDNHTRFHDAACLHLDTPGTLVPGGIPVMGDWNGDGLATPGIFRDGVWYLTNSLDGGDANLVFTYGEPGDIPLVGDWNGDGRDTVGLYRNGLWLLRNDISEGAADAAFLFGDRGDTPVPGDWTGDGVTLPGIVRNGIWYLRYSLTSGTAEHSFAFGLPTDLPFAADFNGDGFCSPGVFRNGHWYLRNTNGFGPPDIEFEYGISGDIPLVTDWTTDKRALPLIVRGSDWHLRDEQSTGPGTRVLQYGTRSNVPALIPN